MLTPDQSFLVTSIYAVWRDKRSWPTVRSMIALLRRERRPDLNVLLQSLPHWIVIGTHRNQDSDPVTLGVRALPHCPGAEHIIEAFLRLHRMAAERFIAAPLDLPKIGADELRQILQTGDAAEFTAISALILEEFVGGSWSGDASNWRKEIGEYILPFSDVSNLEKWVELREANYEVAPQLREEHLFLMGEAYKVWRATGSWPDFRELLVRHRDRGNIYRTYREISKPHFVRETVGARAAHKRLLFELSFEGIAATGLADDDLLVLARSAKLLCDHFINGEEGAALHSTALAKELGLDAQGLQRLQYLISQALIENIVGRQDGGWQIVPSRLILRFEKVDSIEALFKALRSDWKESWRAFILRLPGHEHTLSSASRSEVPVLPHPLQKAKGEPLMKTKQDVWKPWGGGWERREEVLGKGGGGKVYLVRRLAAGSEAEKRRRIELWTHWQQVIHPGGTLNDADRDRLFDALIKFMDTNSNYEYGAAKCIDLPEDRDERKTALARMELELNMMRTFSDHPNCLKLIENGPEEGSFITEFQSGGSLESRSNLLEYCGQLEKTLTAFRGIVDLLSRVHGRKRVHRDVAPKNVFVAKDGKLILGDWGIVWVEDSEGAPLSATGKVLGTKDMMPLWSRHHNVDKKPPSMDVYSMAKTLWMVIAGSKEPLPREEWNDPQYDLEQRFADKPELFYLREIFKNTLVKLERDCWSNAERLAEAFDAILGRIRRTPEPLRPSVKRTCLVCGMGQYQLITSGDDSQQGPNTDRDNGIQHQAGLTANADSTHYRHVARCDSCGHIQFFVWRRGERPAIWRQETSN